MENEPVKRGPGRPRKNPLPEEKQTGLTMDDVEAIAKGVSQGIEDKVGTHRPLMYRTAQGIKLPSKEEIASWPNPDTLDIRKEAEKRLVKNGFRTIAPWRPMKDLNPPEVGWMSKTETGHHILVRWRKQPTNETRHDVRYVTPWYYGAPFDSHISKLSSPRVRQSLRELDAKEAE